jgi:undecaprenyl-diphosphatase
MPLLEAISAWLKAALLPYGGFGLMILAMCDSSFLSLPEVNDFLLMTLSIDNPESMPKLAALTTLGSVIGCSFLYALGRAGGEAILRTHFHDEGVVVARPSPLMRFTRWVFRNLSEDQVMRMRRWYQRYGILAIVIPSLLPPPTPFKVFVVSAGVFGISWPRFILAVTIGRGIRYFSEGLLAIEYGPAAIEFVHNNYGKIGLGLAAAILVTVLVFIYTRRRRMGSIEA